MKIRTEAEYDAVLLVVNMLMDAKPGTQEGAALVYLSHHISEYEEKNTMNKSKKWPPIGESPSLLDELRAIKHLLILQLLSSGMPKKDVEGALKQEWPKWKS